MNKDNTLSEILHPKIKSNYPIIYLVTFEEYNADSLIWELGDGRVRLKSETGVQGLPCEGMSRQGFLGLFPAYGAGKLFLTKSLGGFAALK